VIYVGYVRGGKHRGSHPATVRSHISASMSDNDTNLVDTVQCKGQLLLKAKQLFQLMGLQDQTSGPHEAEL